jgi:hypothetical protein
MSKLLPVVVGSSAATTVFCAERIEGPPDSGDHLWVDGNQKITASNGTYDAPTPNAFSLVQVEDCPMSTPTCRASCYVHGLEAAAKATHDLYRHNSRTLRAIFEERDADGQLLGYNADQPAGRWWARTLGRWIAEHCREFRWHVSGDIFDGTYAWWIARVCEESPAVRHWIYTRSHPLSAAFVGVGNITVNYSVDADNYAAAIPYYLAHAGVGSPVRLCYMATGDGRVPDDLPPGSVIFPDYSLRGKRGGSPAEQRASSVWYQSLPGKKRRMICPVDFYGKSENLRCGPCRKCIDPVTAKETAPCHPPQ